MQVPKELLKLDTYVSRISLNSCKWNMEFSFARMKRNFCNRLLTYRTCHLRNFLHHYRGTFRRTYNYTSKFWKVRIAKRFNQLETWPIIAFVNLLFQVKYYINKFLWKVNGTNFLEIKFSRTETFIVFIWTTWRNYSMLMTMRKLLVFLLLSLVAYILVLFA